MEVPRNVLSALKAGFFSSARARLETALLAGRPRRGMGSRQRLRISITGSSSIRHLKDCPVESGPARALPSRSAGHGRERRVKWCQPPKLGNLASSPNFVAGTLSLARFPPFPLSECWWPVAFAGTFLLFRPVQSGKRSTVDLHSRPPARGPGSPVFQGRSGNGHNAKRTHGATSAHGA